MAKKSSDPQEVVDKNKQKITINPGVRYVSNSQNEIFELRNKANHEKDLFKKNKFIKPPKTEAVDEYADGDEGQIIENLFEPYKLKNQYKIEHKEEIDFDNDEENALLLGSQPYETVTSIAFGDYLNHLPTKFVARRSDIIVSSTLSITLTPTDEKYVEPLHLAKAEEDEIREYVDKRS